MINRNLALAILALAAVLAGWLYLDHLYSRVEALTVRAEAAEARAEILTAQAELNRSVADVGAAQAAAVQQTYRTANEAKDEVEHSTDLEAALDRFTSGIQRLRGDRATASVDPPVDRAGSNAGP
jgi:hypothetical protein